MKNILTREFYTSSNVNGIAKKLLGKELVVCFNDFFLSGIISETEAYAGINDKASHAYNNKKTNRTKNMFMNGGMSYVYICYGIHFLFNVVTNKEDFPDAVLIRSIIPFKGLNIMKSKNIKINGVGPGRVTKLLNISKIHNGIDLCGNEIFINDINLNISNKNIINTKRVGIDYAEEDALLPYRYIIDKETINKIKIKLKINE